MAKIDGGLRTLFRQHLLHFDWTSIESGTTGGGIPDSNFCCQGVEGWIEYKQAPGHTVTLRPEQVGWIARRVRAGGRVWIAVRQRAPAGPRRAARDTLWLAPGRHVVLARSGGIHALAALPPSQGVHCWHDGPAAWYWDQIGALLVA